VLQSIRPLLRQRNDAWPAVTVRGQRMPRSTTRTLASGSRGFTEQFSPAIFLFMRLLTNPILALFTLLASSAISQAAMPAQECLAKANELTTDAMKRAPRGEEGGVWGLSQETINDMKMLCLKDDADGTVRMIYNKVCPRNEMCDKIKVLVDNGVSQRHKDCINRTLKEFDSNSEMKRQTFPHYTPEVVFMMAAFGVRVGRCDRNQKLPPTVSPRASPIPDAKRPPCTIRRNVRFGSCVDGALARTF
jgi:hypothetical protein